MKKVKVNRFWGKFQSFVGASIPEILVKILISAGYDNALSISDLNECDIDILQPHVQDKLKDLLSQSNVYKDCEQFVFLPGHKKTLFSLRDKAKEFVEQKKQSKREEHIELLTPEEIISLKGRLFEKLNSCAESIGLSSKFGEDNLKSFIDAYISHNSRHANKKPGYKCTVECISCGKQIPCTHNCRWETANLEKHLKTHTNKPTPTNPANGQIQHQEQNKSTNGHNKSTKKSSNAPISDELSKVLGLKENH